MYANYCSFPDVQSIHKKHQHTGMQANIQTTSRMWDLDRLQKWQVNWVILYEIEPTLTCKFEFNMYTVSANNELLRLKNIWNTIHFIFMEIVIPKVSDVPQYFVFMHSLNFIYLENKMAIYSSRQMLIFLSYNGLLLFCSLMCDMWITMQNHSLMEDIC